MKNLKLRKRLLRNRKSLTISILAILIISALVGSAWIWKGLKVDGTNPLSINVFCGQFGNGTYFSNNGSYTLGSSCSAIINDAISEVSSAGSGHVTLVNGTWILTSPIVPQSNVNLTCYSGVTISQNAPAALNDSISLMLNTDGGVNNFVVDGGIWNGNKGGLSDFRDTSTWNANFFLYLGIGIYGGATSTGITIENLVIENVIGQGIDLLSCENVYVYNVTALNNGDNPIVIDEDCSNCTVNACKDVGGQDVGIDTFYATNCTIENCNVANVTQYAGASHWGIGAEESTNVNILNNVVSGCDYNIVSTSDDVLISGNNVNGLGYSNFGIQIQTADNNIVSFNTVTGCDNALGTYVPITQTLNLTLQGNIGFSGYCTLNVTTAGSGCGTVSEFNAWCDQGLASISGNNWQFPTGSTTTLTATGSSESSFDNFTLTNGTETTSNPLSLVMNGNVEATAYFDASYTISASSDSHSTISPSGSVQVKAGGSQTFTYSADAGYKVTSVLVDASPVPITGSYTFTNVQAPHTITVSATLTLTPTPQPTTASTPASTSTSTPTIVATQTPSVINTKMLFPSLLVIAIIAITVGTAFLVTLIRKRSGAWLFRNGQKRSLIWQLA